MEYLVRTFLFACLSDADSDTELPILCRYDNAMKDLTEKVQKCNKLYLWIIQRVSLMMQDMEEGIKASKIVIIFLSEGVFGRPFVRSELTWAFKYKKPIIAIHEDDSRHGKFDFGKPGDVPPEFKEYRDLVLYQIESM